MPRGPIAKTAPRIVAKRSSEPATMGAMTNTAGFTPTAEQADVLAKFQVLRPGDVLAVEAGAGAGKTSTLMLLAADATARGLRGSYFAFNKAIVKETEMKAQSRGYSLTVKTVHGAAHDAIMKPNPAYMARLRSSVRMKSGDIARMLGITALSNVGDESKFLSAGYLASVVQRGISNFCQSADREPSSRHLSYIEGIDTPKDGHRTYEANDKVRKHLAPAMAKAWADVLSPTGRLPFKHEHYLKMWELSGPVVAADYILFDECQDVSPVMASIIAQQTCPKVYVGDSAQAIYGFTGAIDSLAKIIADGAVRATLSQSFRFGPEVAEVANRTLARVGVDMTIVGAGKPGLVDVCDEPDVLLCRTNARAVESYASMLEAGRKAHIVGGGDEVVRFARAAIDLNDKGFTAHPELGCFKSWAEVVEYVEEDEQGSELRLMVSLVNTFGASRLISMLSRMPSEKDAEVIISTAHKAKGREWARVLLTDDFPPHTDERPLSVEEWRLLYVAVTRAAEHLDISALPHLAVGA
jgi:superfamily I DNA/RNA helicase